jgi:sorbitol-specific phosphotransferase system component IIBC
MMGTMIIEITQSDIDIGVKCDSFKCPLALALNRQVPADFLAVGVTVVWIDNEVFRLTDEAFAFRSAFDKGFNVKPCTIRVYE